MKSTRKKDIKHGKKDLLTSDEFDPKYGKERITIYIDQQVVDAFREKAKKKGEKYQSLMREALRQSIYGIQPSDIETRLEKIEDILFKKKRA